MKNLTPLTRTTHYWDAIINAKDLINRVPLQASRAVVFTRFTDYSSRCTPCVLETITASPFIIPLIGHLKGCYNTSNGLTVLKTRINERQPIALRAECQYCNISEPNSFDHYLPKGDFPEFSALSINLIPCCSKCNSAKGVKWLLAGNRATINFYYDVLPNVNYLSCSIVYRQNIPFARFRLNTAVIPPVMRNIIANHFSTLELISRYQERSNSEIMDVHSAITPYVGNITRIQIQTNLINEANRMKLNKGINYWRAEIRIAIANSIPFLTAAGF